MGFLEHELAEMELYIHAEDVDEEYMHKWALVLVLSLAKGNDSGGKH